MQIRLKMILTILQNSLLKKHMHYQTFIAPSPTNSMGPINLILGFPHQKPTFLKNILETHL